MKKKEIRTRCWVEINGVKHFGPGPAELLELISNSGSIAKAAKKMGMSYKKAWAMVSNMNARGQKPYVIVQQGGQQGGGAQLSATGKNVLKSFNKLNKKVQAIIKKESQLLKLI